MHFLKYKIHLHSSATVIFLSEFFGFFIKFHSESTLRFLIVERGINYEFGKIHHPFQFIMTLSICDFLWKSPRVIADPSILPFYIFPSNKAHFEPIFPSSTYWKLQKIVRMFGGFQRVENWLQNTLKEAIVHSTLTRNYSSNASAHFNSI